jgi:hypothetical protein
MLLLLKDGDALADQVRSKLPLPVAFCVSMNESMLKKFHRCRRGGIE